MDVGNEQVENERLGRVLVHLLLFMLADSVRILLLLLRPLENQLGIVVHYERGRGGHRGGRRRRRLIPIVVVIEEYIEQIRVLAYANAELIQDGYA
jgi:hypothetical protein